MTSPKDPPEGIKNMRNYLGLPPTDPKDPQAELREAIKKALNYSKSPDRVEEIMKIFQAHQQELEKTLIALAYMYDQYCGDNFGHDFMGAGEDAIEILENHGLGDERKGIDHTALTELERKIGELNG